MVAQRDSQVVVPFAEGITEDVIADIDGGAITTSRNTRLTVRKGTLTRRPAFESVGTGGPAGEPCGAMAVGPGDSIACYFKTNTGQKRICAGQLDTLVSPLDGDQPQNAWYPYQIIEAGEAFTVRGGYPPSVAIDTDGNTWMTVLGTSGQDFGIFVTVYNSDHELIAPQQFLLMPSTGLAFPENLGSWSSLTAASTGGVNLWYATSTSIYGTLLSVASSVVTIAVGPTLIVTPGGGALLLECAVCADNAGNSYLLHRHASTATSAVATKVSSSALTVTSSLSFATTIASSGVASLACSWFGLGSGSHLLVAIAHSSAATAYMRVVNANAMTQTAANSHTDTGVLNVAVQPFLHSSNNLVCMSVSHLGTDPVFTDYTYAKFLSYDMVTGALNGECERPWVFVLGNGTYHMVSITECYPYFPVAPYLYSSLGGYSPSVGNYVADPSISVLSPSSAENMTVVARYGVDRAANAIYPDYIGNTMHSTGSRLVCTYKYQDQARAALAVYGDTSNWVEIDLEPSTQPGIAHDAGGSATVAAGYPVVWDGQETLDLTVPYMPVIFAEDTGGVGTALTGTYSWRAVHSWKDKAGNLHRSAPSLPVSLTLAGTSPVVAVSAPLIMKNGITQDYADVTLYQTDADGSIFYAVSALPDGGYPSTLGCYVFNDLPDTDSSNDRIYSTGANEEPLVNTCPPPAWDVETIGSRQWIINAEFRNRLHPSKLKEAGIAFEYAPELAIDVDRQYGRLVKVADIGGRVYVLAERGVWAIGGYGPDNSGQGSGFSDPQLVLNTGCKYRHSVAQIPGIGVMFQAEDGRFALLSGGGGLERFERINAHDVAAPLIHVNECEVVYPLSDGTGFVVYNWLAKGWTKWAPTVDETEEDVTVSAHLRSGSGTLSYLYDRDTGAVRSVDSTSVDELPGSELYVTRGWIVPEQPQGDCVFRECWFQLLSPEGWRHGFTAEFCFDYDDTAVVTRSWDADELESLQVNGRVAVGVNLHGTCARAIKINLYDSIEETNEDNPGATDYMQPLHATITFGASNGVRRRTAKAGALK